MSTKKAVMITLDEFIEIAKEKRFNVENEDTSSVEIHFQNATIDISDDGLFTIKSDDNSITFDYSTDNDCEDIEIEYREDDNSYELIFESFSLILHPVISEAMLLDEFADFLYSQSQKVCEILDISFPIYSFYSKELTGEAITSVYDMVEYDYNIDTIFFNKEYRVYISNERYLALMLFSVIYGLRNKWQLQNKKDFLMSFQKSNKISLEEFNLLAEIDSLAFASLWLNTYYDKWWDDSIITFKDKEKVQERYSELANELKMS